MKILDLYIIKKFLSTFILAISLLAILIMVFDVSEKIDDFIDKQVSLKMIVFDYYLNFIPFFINMFSALFTFITVIFFTSKMAFNTEIIAILGSGISFRRLLRPYIITATLIGIASFALTNFIIPNTNKQLFEFQETYLKGNRRTHNVDIHMQIAPGKFIYVESYNADKNIGQRFTLEQYQNNQLISKLWSDNITWIEKEQKWRLKNWNSREIFQNKEILTSGKSCDTAINLHPKDFIVTASDMMTMDWFMLRQFINKERMKGSSNITVFEVEKHKRIAFPFANIILALIGVSLSSQKLKGGTGMHLGIGIAITFSYILLIQISSVFSTFGNISPMMAAWIPNIIFFIISLFLLCKAPK